MQGGTFKTSLDSTTHANVNVTYAHHEIHAGSGAAVNVTFVLDWYEHTNKTL